MGVALIVLLYDSEVSQRNRTGISNLHEHRSTSIAKQVHALMDCAKSHEVAVSTNQFDLHTSFQRHFSRLFEIIHD